MFILQCQINTQTTAGNWFKIADGQTVAGSLPDYLKTCVENEAYARKSAERTGRTRDTHEYRLTYVV